MIVPYGDGYLLIGYVRPRYISAYRQISGAYYALKFFIEPIEDEL